MKPDQERMKTLLTDTILLLCKNGLCVKRQLKVQGLLGITLDDDDIFLIQIDEMISDDVNQSSINNCHPSQSYSVMHDRIPVLSPSFDSQNDIFVDPNFQFLNRNDLSADQLPPANHLEKRLHGKMELKKCRLKEDQQQLNPLIVKVEEVEEDIITMGEHVSSNSTTTIPSSSSLFNNEQQLFFLSPSQLKNVVKEEDKQCYVVAEGSKSEFEKEKRKAKRKYDDDIIVMNRQIETITKQLLNVNKKSIPFIDESNRYEPWQLLPLNNFSHDFRNNCEENDDDDYNDNDLSWMTQLQLQHQKKNRNNVKTRRASISEDRDTTVICEYDGCGRSFYHRYTLYRHQRIKHGRRFGTVNQLSFFCPHVGCQRIFYRQLALLKHQQSVHQQNNKHQAICSSELI